MGGPGHGMLVGEKGLEPSTRSTQSYEAPLPGGVAQADSGGVGASAYPGASNGRPDPGPGGGADGALVDLLLGALRGLDPVARERLRAALDELGQREEGRDG